MLNRLTNYLQFIGYDLRASYRNIKGVNWFLRDLKEIKRQLQNRPDFPISKLNPQLADKYSDSGTLSGHYFHQDLLVANRIFLNNPLKHVDIGSRTDGFVAHVASFREIEVFDIRPLENTVKNIKFVQADFMQLDSKLVSYTDSISCLHAIEHFGLGRYNDPIDVDGHLKGLHSIYQALKPGGKFYFSTPIGSQRIEFNAHRVFSISYLLNLFNDKYQLNSFSFVDDLGNLHENTILNDKLIGNNCSCEYGCGIFELTKI